MSDWGSAIRFFADGGCRDTPWISPPGTDRIRGRARRSRIGMVWAITSQPPLFFESGNGRLADHVLLVLTGSGTRRNLPACRTSSATTRSSFSTSPASSTRGFGASGCGGCSWTRSSGGLSSTWARRCSCGSCIRSGAGFQVQVQQQQQQQQRRQQRLQLQFQIQIRNSARFRSRSGGGGGRCGCRGGRGCLGCRHP